MEDVYGYKLQRNWLTGFNKKNIQCSLKMSGHWVGNYVIIFPLPVWSLGDRNSSKHHFLIWECSNQDQTQENKRLDFVKAKICPVPGHKSW